MFEYRRDFNHIRQVAPRVRVAQSSIQVLVQITIIRYFPSVQSFDIVGWATGRTSGLQRQWLKWFF